MAPRLPPQRIDRQDHHLGRRQQHAVAAGLQDPAHHHQGKAAAQNAEQDARDEAADAGHIQFFGGKAGDEKGGQRHDHTHGQGIAAGDPLSHRGGDAEIRRQIGQRGGHGGGQDRCGDAGDHQIDENQGPFPVSQLREFACFHGVPPFCAKPYGGCYPPYAGASARSGPVPPAGSPR